MDCYVGSLEYPIINFASFVDWLVVWSTARHGLTCQSQVWRSERTLGVLGQEKISLLRPNSDMANRFHHYRSSHSWYDSRWQRVSTSVWIVTSTAVLITSGCSQYCAPNREGPSHPYRQCFGTARILFLSGIGPTDRLNIVKNHVVYRLNLPASTAWINFPVGNYVSDNPSINVSHR